MATDLWLTHRGAITGLVALGEDALLFSTTHPEAQPGAVHRLDPDKGTLTSWLVPRGVQALAARGAGYALVSGERRLYLGDGKAAPQAVGAPVPADAVALAPV
ncbi:MAG: hypothetical protein KC613_21675, partial [Myxococcales bacterium]|nr:hypothetical protein [Myxococcales bacterium]